MTQWFRRAAALRTKCLNLVLELDENPGSGSASERTSQSRQLMLADVRGRANYSPGSFLPLALNGVGAGIPRGESR